ncbi:MAG: hypothetical protein J5744_05615 [Oscillospiraceae bacterium]|nr:hypothetical protein [Oscillospiraceae bacterium]
MDSQFYDNRQPFPEVDPVTGELRYPGTNQYVPRQNAPVGPQYPYQQNGGGYASQQYPQAQPATVRSEYANVPSGNQPYQGQRQSYQQGQQYAAPAQGFTAQQYTVPAQNYQTPSQPYRGADYQRPSTDSRYQQPYETAGYGVSSDENARLRAELEELRALRERAERELEENRNAAARAYSEAESIRRERDSALLQAENARLQNEAIRRQAETDLAALREESEKRQQEALAQYRMELAAQDNEREQQLTETRNSLEQQRRQAQEELQRIEEERRKLEEARSQVSDLQMTFAVEKDRLAAERQKLDQDVAASEQIKKQLEDEKNSLEMAKQDAELQRSTLEASKLQFNQQRTELEASRLQFDQQRTELEASKLQFDQQRNALAQDRARFQENVQALEKSAQQLAAERSSIEQFKKQIEDEKSEAEALRQRLAQDREALDKNAQELGLNRAALEKDKVRLAEERLAAEEFRRQLDKDRAALEQSRQQSKEELEARERLLAETERQSKFERASVDENRMREAEGLRAFFEAQREEAEKMRIELERERAEFEQQKQDNERVLQQIEEQRKLLMTQGVGSGAEQAAAPESEVAQKTADSTPETSPFGKLFGEDRVSSDSVPVNADYRERDVIPEIGTDEILEAVRSEEQSKAEASDFSFAPDEVPAVSGPVPITVSFDVSEPDESETPSVDSKTEVPDEPAVSYEAAPQTVSEVFDEPEKEVLPEETAEEDTHSEAYVSAEEPASEAPAEEPASEATVEEPVSETPAEEPIEINYDLVADLPSFEKIDSFDDLLSEEEGEDNSSFSDLLGQFSTKFDVPDFTEPVSVDEFVPETAFVTEAPSLQEVSSPVFEPDTWEQAETAPAESSEDAAVFQEAEHAEAEPVYEEAEPVLEEDYINEPSVTEPVITYDETGLPAETEPAVADTAVVYEDTNEQLEVAEDTIPSLAPAEDEGFRIDFPEQDTVPAEETAFEIVSDISETTAPLYESDTPAFEGGFTVTEELPDLTDFREDSVVAENTYDIADEGFSLNEIEDFSPVLDARKEREEQEALEQTATVPEQSPEIEKLDALMADFSPRFETVEPSADVSYTEETARIEDETEQVMPEASVPEETVSEDFPAEPVAFEIDERPLFFDLDERTAATEDILFPEVDKAAVSEPESVIENVEPAAEDFSIDIPEPMPEPAPVIEIPTVQASDVEEQEPVVETDTTGEDLFDFDTAVDDLASAVLRDNAWLYSENNLAPVGEVVMQVNELTSKYYVNEVDCSYPAFKEVSLDFPAGACTAVISSVPFCAYAFVRAIACPEEVAEGSVMLGNRKLTHNDMIYIGSDRLIEKKMSTIDWLMSTIGGSAEQKNAKLLPMLEQLGMTNLADAELESLSYSQRMLILLVAVSFSNTPVVLINDPQFEIEEVDVNAACAAFKILADSGKTVLVAGHSPRLMRSVANRVLAIHYGNPVFSGSYRSFIDENCDALVLFHSDNAEELEERLSADERFVVVRDRDIVELQRAENSTAGEKEAIEAAKEAGVPVEDLRNGDKGFSIAYKEVFKARPRV